MELNRPRGMLPVAVLIALLGAVACSRSADRSSLDSLPQSVSDAVAALAAQCRAVDGIPQTDDTVRRGDFTKDGRDDFVLYAGWMACVNAASVFGDREKDVTVFTGDASGGASWAFGDSVYDVAIEDADGKLQLWFTVSAGQCGQPPAATFSEESFCDRALLWSASTSRFDYEPVSAARMLR